MAKKSAPSPAPSESELVEAVNRLTDCVSVLADIATLLRSDIDWIIKNRAEFPLLQTTLTQPAASRSQEEHSTITRPETIVCTDCDAPSPASLAAALREGWIELTPHDGEHGNYVGLCPDCLESAETRPKKAAAEDFADEDRTESEHPKDTLF